jgi:hypothetical protein
MKSLARALVAAAFVRVLTRAALRDLRDWRASRREPIYGDSGCA